MQGLTPVFGVFFKFSSQEGPHSLPVNLEESTPRKIARTRAKIGEMFSTFLRPKIHMQGLAPILRVYFKFSGQEGPHSLPINTEESTPR